MKGREWERGREEGVAVQDCEEGERNHRLTGGKKPGVMGGRRNRVRESKELHSEDSPQRLSEDR